MPHCHFVHQNHTWTELGSNPGRRGGMKAIVARPHQELANLPILVELDNNGFNIKIISLYIYFQNALKIQSVTRCLIFTKTMATYINTYT
jgi:hypothetical protein